MIQDKPRSITRTWTVTTAHEMDRVIVMTTTHTITLSADHAGHVSAQVDGQTVTPQRADHLLRTAIESHLLSETRTLPLLPVPTFPWGAA
ncbi:hypothetical protein ACMT4L_06845 [Deinococcus sp. A31D244]|uniref:hypothetical protein n=1 Tax=Deinococcus sp. A31D244 TaxID=3397675 RepID=UPI0039E19C9F